MPAGGKRKGAGRPTVAQELATADLARSALIKKYGSLELALNALLDMGEPALIKFVFEHAFGKAPDKIEGSVNSHITLKIVRGKLNP